MRYLLIALMIVLLPLRGWAGNAMAVDMAAQQVLVAQASAASAAAMVAESAMPADCPMHLQAVADKADQASPVNAHCSSCDTCQLCLALATWTQPDWPAGAMSRPGAPLLAGTSFRSADSAASLKPPIS
jgi:hypothetical protein